MGKEVGRVNKVRKVTEIGRKIRGKEGREMGEAETYKRKIKSCIFQAEFLKHWKVS